MASSSKNSGPDNSVFSALKLPPLDESRRYKLTQLFKGIISGKKQLQPVQRRQFLESICVQQDPTECAHGLNSDTGRAAISSATRSDLSPSALTKPVSNVLLYLSHVEISLVDEGKYLVPVLKAILNPPIFWDAFVDAFRARCLDETGQIAFAWLLLQILTRDLDEVWTSRALALGVDSAIISLLENSSSSVAAALAAKIKSTCGALAQGEALTFGGPGGRHDNDIVDYRKIQILPTRHELTSKDSPFLPKPEDINDVDPQGQKAFYLDMLFRLLREDMLADLRDELLRATSKSSKQRVYLDNLTVDRIYVGNNEKRKVKWGVVLRNPDCLPQLQKIQPEDLDERIKKRVAFLRSDENRNILKHGTLACLLADNQVVSFGTLHRDETLLSEDKAGIVVQVTGKLGTKDFILSLASRKNLKLVQVDTSVFAFEPILKALQELKTLPFAHEILNPSLAIPPSLAKATSTLTTLIQKLEVNPKQDIKPLIKTKKSIFLDPSQMNSLLSALKQKVSLIQGPPGCGKSFIGALISRILHDHLGPDTIILCVCFTNHALDAFLEDLLDIGIPESQVGRLGGKVLSPRIEPLSLLGKGGLPRVNLRGFGSRIDQLQSNRQVQFNHLESLFASCCQTHPEWGDILSHLEFEDPEAFFGLEVPEEDDGMIRVGRNGKRLDSFYLIQRWVRGQSPGIFARERGNSGLWQIPPAARAARFQEWSRAVLEERVNRFVAASAAYDSATRQLDEIFTGGSLASLIATKRVIGCTTTGAAKHRAELLRAKPKVLLCEEAGEILEQHTITALSQQTERMVLIGDHKQLRPKVNNYNLSCEKGDGFDLNRSLFERLVLAGYPHETLTSQHRMRPEISRFVRELTYQDLEDAPTTSNRDSIRGVRGDVIFISHSKPEEDEQKIADRRQGESKASRRNNFEAEMVIKVVKYLYQQSYRTEDICVLTPYLGQLFNLRKRFLDNNHDPVLSDGDAHELVRAGLLSPATAKEGRQRLLISTIDNFQGEEKKIVIISLTRSNSRGDIGFMYQPERLNVLLSRARDGMILLGNPETFRKARKGGELWSRLFNMLSANGSIHHGFPVHCLNHGTLNLLKAPEDFDTKCPQGGCLQACKVQLPCGHACSLPCHNLIDHSKFPCETICSQTCPKGHVQQWPCNQGPPSNCRVCVREQKREETKRRKEYEAKQKREAEDAAHRQRLAEIELEIEKERERVNGVRMAQEREDALKKKREDLEAARRNADNTLKKASDKKSSPGSNQTSNHDPPSDPLEGDFGPIPPEFCIKASDAKTEWERQTLLENEHNTALDELMKMTGLEEIKSQFLDIKAKVDLANRQDVALDKEIFHARFLGNPGTGKTTVARLYGKFLGSIGALSGTAFVESTGAKIANEGVKGLEKMISNTANQGGGTIFIDESYQLVSPSHPGGGAVLDALLTEMLDHLGKICFVFAGYTKEMEDFVSHNPGITSRVPHVFTFADYTNAELLHMFQTYIEKRWKSRMRLQDGHSGLSVRVGIRRLGRQRGSRGFGNARSLHNMVAQIATRQARRVKNERKEGRSPDEFFLTRQDLIGPEPSLAVKRGKAWKDLNQMIGLGDVKAAVQAQLDLIQTNYVRELQEKEPLEISLHKVFTGNPGTGKTSVAMIYGNLLGDLGLLSNGEVVIKNPSDFIGAHLGASEKNTKAILESTIGKVLVIDEFYGLYGGGGGGADQYKEQVINTIVAEVQAVPGEDRCILALGYKKQMEEMFQNVNPGLSRRLKIEDAWNFADYSNEELSQILDLKMKKQNIGVTDSARRALIDMLSRSRIRPNFGNAGEIENKLSEAKLRYQRRQSVKPIHERDVDCIFEPQDFDPDYDRSQRSDGIVEDLFKDFIGFEKIVSELKQYQQLARANRRDLIPHRFVFTGPPGTGKTSAARNYGELYFQIGILAKPEVIECSASDMIAGYVGQTAGLVKAMFQKALGKVLFIDEAYRLGQGHFAQEAIDEIVDCCTKEDFDGKLIIILAGYENDINKLFSVNSGLSSRFAHSIPFYPLSASQCLRMLHSAVEKQNLTLSIDEDTPMGRHIVSTITQLCGMPSWGNARDIKTLATSIARGTLAKNPAATSVSLPTVLTCLLQMQKQKESRESSSLNSRSGTLGSQPPIAPPQTGQAPPPPSTSASANHDSPQTSRTDYNDSDSDESEGSEADVDENDDGVKTATRDVGVSDEVWEQLEKDKQEQERKKAEQKEELARLRAKQEEEKRREEEEKKERERMEAEVRAAERAKAAARDKKIAEEHEQRRQDALRRQNEARLREEQARIRAIEAAAREAARQREIKKEKENQMKLRKMGKCVAGFDWIRQGTGYRCAGGSHFVSHQQLEG